MTTTTNEVQTVHSIEITLKPGVAGTKDVPGQRPVTRTIPPGSLIRLKDGDEYKALVEAGAVKVPDGKHKLDLRNPDGEGNVDLSVAAHKVPRSLLPGAGSNPSPATDDFDGDEHQNEANRRQEADEATVEGEEGDEETTKTPTPKAPAQTGSQKTPPAKK